MFLYIHLVIEVPLLACSLNSVRIRICLDTDIGLHESLNIFTQQISLKNKIIPNYIYVWMDNKYKAVLKAKSICRNNLFKGGNQIFT